MNRVVARSAISAMNGISAEGATPHARHAAISDPLQRNTNGRVHVTWQQAAGFCPRRRVWFLWQRNGHGRRHAPGGAKEVAVRQPLRAHLVVQEHGRAEVVVQHPRTARE